MTLKAAFFFCKNCNIVKVGHLHGHMWTTTIMPMCIVHELALSL
jgi:hypothetical protein